MHPLAAVAVALLVPAVSATRVYPTAIESVTTRTSLKCRTTIAATSVNAVPTTTRTKHSTVTHDLVYIYTYRPLHKVTPAPTTTTSTAATSTVTTTLPSTASVITVTTTTTLTTSTDSTTTTTTTTETTTGPTSTSTILATSSIPTPAGWWPPPNPTTRRLVRKRKVPKPGVSKVKPPLFSVHGVKGQSKLFAQQVSCVLFVWTVPVQTLVFLGPSRTRMLPTPTVTTVSTPTSTVTTAPNYEPTTVTMTNYTTAVSTSTETSTTTITSTPILTVSSTVTSYAACATDYLLGPNLSNGEVLDDATWSSALGVSYPNATDAQDCCAQCWSDSTCAGSIFMTSAGQSSCVYATADNSTLDAHGRSVADLFYYHNPTSNLTATIAGGPVGLWIDAGHH